MSWPTVSLGEIAKSVDYGLTASATDRPVGPKFLRITDIQDDAVDWDSVPYCVADSSQMSRNRLADGDIVFARTGGTTGKSFLVRNPPNDAVFASYLIRVRPSERLDAVFLSHFFRSPNYWSQIEKAARGAAQPGVNASILKELIIPLPAIEEQRRIAAILDKANEIGRKRQQTLELADALLRSTFLEMFGDPVSNPKKLPISPIKAMGRVVTGNTPPRNDPENYGPGIEWIKSDNVGTLHHFLTNAEETLTQKGQAISRTVPAGSTLVTCIAGSPSSIGNAALADREVAFNQQINAVVPNPGVDPFFLYCQFLVGKRLVQNASTNSMKGMVSKGKFQEIAFLNPSSRCQERFGHLFMQVLRTAEKLRTGCAEDNALIGSLAQRAFRGEL